MPQPEDFQSPEQVMSSTLGFSGKLLKLEVRKIRTRSGRETVREIVQHPGAVAMVVADAAGNVLLIRQWRSAAGRWLYEIPAGTREPDESAELCAAREVEEETSFRPALVQRIGGFYLAPGYSTEYIDLYLATDLTEGDLTAEDDENIELMPMTLDAAVELIVAGEIEDAKTIAGLLLYKQLRGLGMRFEVMKRILARHKRTIMRGGAALLLLAAMSFGLGWAGRAASNHYTTALFHDQRGEYTQAIADYSAAIANLPDLYAYEARARDYQLIGSDELALADYQLITNFYPNQAATIARADIAMGDIYRQRGEYAAAIDRYSAAIAREPRSYLAHYGRGLAYKAQGAADKARADFQLAAQVAPSTKSAQQAKREISGKW